LLKKIFGEDDELKTLLRFLLTDRIYC